MDLRRTSRTARALALLGAGALMLTAAPTAGAATTRNVPCSGPDGGVAGLRAAITKANNHGGGRITLARNCTYTFTDGPYSDQTGGNALPIITSRVVILGNGSKLVRRSPDQFRFFEVSDEQGAALVVRKAVLARGATTTAPQNTNNGGAIYSVGRLVLGKVTLRRNSSANGGALQAEGGTVRIVRSTLVRNHARDVPGATAGAIAVIGARITLRQVTLSNNDAIAKGGAIALFSGAIRMSDSTVTGNTVSINGEGGGIFNYGRLRITRTTFADNQANGFGGNGGAIANYDKGDLVLTDSEIAGNTAGMAQGVSQAFGGGIANFGDARLARVEITRNSALGGKATGGGIAVKAGELAITASTVRRNNPNNCSGPIQGRC